MFWEIFPFRLRRMRSKQEETYASFQIINKEMNFVRQSCCRLYLVAIVPWFTRATECTRTNQLTALVLPWRSDHSILFALGASDRFPSTRSLWFSLSLPLSVYLLPVRRIDPATFNCRYRSSSGANASHFFAHSRGRSTSGVKIQMSGSVRENSVCVSVKVSLCL